MGEVASAPGVAEAPSGQSFALSREDGVELQVHRWEPTVAPKACVLIVHGMGEHGARYGRFAAALTAAGYAVYAPDHRGHGKTAQLPGDLGYFADRDGWRCVVDDVYAVNRRIAADHEHLPVLLIGHSMGSVIAQHYLFCHGDSIAGAVLSGSGGDRKARARLGLVVAAAERLRLGPRGKSALLQFASVGVFNQRFRPLRTDCDWLSSDPAEVDKYVADPLCGAALSVQSWHDFFQAMLEAEKLDNLRRMPEGLPVFFVAGELDPAGDFGKGPRHMARLFRKAGMGEVDIKLYPGMRHEILNEVDREQVHRDVIAWLDAVLARKR